jgi:hypothetical protein
MGIVAAQKQATILQFTSHGKVTGYRRRIDVNAFRGTTAELAALAGPGGAFIPLDDGPDDVKDDIPPVDGLGRGSSSGPSDSGDDTPRFHNVVQGDTLFDIAIRFGWEAEDGRPATGSCSARSTRTSPFAHTRS